MKSSEHTWMSMLWYLVDPLNLGKDVLGVGTGGGLFELGSPDFSDTSKFGFS